MRFALVTSEVNYVKDNYRHLLHSVLREHKDSIQALVVVQTISLQLCLKVIGLYLIGAPRIATNLLRNIIRAFFSKPFEEFKRQGVSVHFTPNINTSETLNWLRGLNLDLLVNVRTRNIFRKAALEIPKWGAINIHHGVLPERRGTMCDLWALYEGRPVGYSIHWMNAKIDDGALIRVRTLGSLPSKNYGEIPYLSSLQEAKDLCDILETLRRSNGKIDTTPNQSTEVSHTRNPTRSELKQMRAKGVLL